MAPTFSSLSRSASILMPKMVMQVEISGSLALSIPLHMCVVHPFKGVQKLIYSVHQLCCAVIGCWLTEPLNRYFGRRGTIFITATISFLACIWQAVTNSWPHLFIARFVLGLGIGPKSATVPVYAAECAPSPIRGALVMMWQTWTAFGIMIGYVAVLAFFRVPNKPHITGLNWRLMLASVSFGPSYLYRSQF